MSLNLIHEEPYEGPRHQQARERPPRWVLLLIIVGMFVMAYWGISNQLSADSERALATLQSQTAQGNAVNLADEIQARCATEKSVIVGDRDLCAKAEAVQANPTEPLQGLKGDKGDTGPMGPAGRDGKDGADSTVPGPVGATGATGAVGATGSPGADGEDGTDGTDGADGAPGQPPSSITITDASGRTQTCTPNPPGSTQYTCTYDQQGAPL